jgi:hypothetical protein
MRKSYVHAGLIAASLSIWTAAPARAQAPATGGPEQEVRNAYEHECTISANRPFANCTMQALPSGKRLAIRWLTAVCTPTAGRMNFLTLFGRMPVGNVQGQTITLFKPAPFASAHTGAIQVVSEPVYVQTDFAPTIAADAPNEFQGSCRVEVRGFLVDKP